MTTAPDPMDILRQRSLQDLHARAGTSAPLEQRAAVKPWQGIIGDWHMEGDRITGRVIYARNGHHRLGERGRVPMVTTSQVQSITRTQQGVYVAETLNSFYVLDCNETV